MKRIIMYPHGGSGNHGCEAIIRSTYKILPDYELNLFSAGIEQDNNVNLGEVCKIYNDKHMLKKGTFRYFIAALKYHLRKDLSSYDYEVYRHMFEMADNNTLAFSVGGDNYCYGVPQLFIFMNKCMKEKGAKLVLWGCSVEPDSIHGEMLEEMKRFDLIAARESISYEALKMVNPNTVLCADPAFQLDTEYLPLPEGFVEGNTIGINVSPMIIDNEENDGITLKCYQNLIEFIIDKTDMNIALIPHVCWESNDDRKPLRVLFEKYKETKRIVMLEEYDCQKVKGFIARCRFMVVARTHASIAAYSSCVPTLVVGYSVKARGIAKDIFGTDENYVVPVQSLKNEEDLTKAFSWIYENEISIKKHLNDFMPEYKNRVYIASQAIKKL